MEVFLTAFGVWVIIIIGVLAIMLLPDYLQQRAKDKVSACIHVYRLIHVEYAYLKYEENDYIYRCNVCKKTQRIRHRDKADFENTFMTDWWEKDGKL